MCALADWAVSLTDITGLQQLLAEPLDDDEEPVIVAMPEGEMQ